MNRVLRPLLAGLAAAAVLTTTITGPAAADPPVPSELTATVNVTTVNAGQSISITGTIRRLTADGWVGVSAAHIHVRHCVDQACTESWGAGATQSQLGGWAFGTTPARTGFYRVRFDPSVWPSTSDMAPETVDLPQVNVLQPTSNGIITAERLSSGAVRVYGVVSFPSYVLPPTAPVVRIEFSTDNAGWTAAGTATSRYFHNGSYVYDTASTQSLPGYWRTVYDGVPTAAQASTSSATYVS